MDTKKEFIEKLLSINPNYNTESIEKAYEVAERLHDGQVRKSGEPYLIHPVNVAYILAELGMDESVGFCMTWLRIQSTPERTW